MQCPGCGQELPAGANVCASCGHEVTTAQKAVAGSKAVVSETGAVAGKIGKGLVGGAKLFGSGVKKGFKGSEEEKKE